MNDDIKGLLIGIGGGIILGMLSFFIWGAGSLFFHLDPDLVDWQFIRVLTMITMIFTTFCGIPVGITYIRDELEERRRKLND
jgi:hypothetical protein